MSAVVISPRRRRDVIDALRRGTVPRQGLDVLAVGLSRFKVAVDDELESVAGGGAGFKALRGEYGSGKTFFCRWLVERACWEIRTLGPKRCAHRSIIGQTLI